MFFSQTETLDLELNTLDLNTTGEISDETSAAVIIAVAIAVVIISIIVYILNSIFLKKIAIKDNQESPNLAWIPIVQILVLIRAAKTADWHIIFGLIPYINGIYFIYLLVKVAREFNKNVFVTLVLSFMLGPVGLWYLSRD